jgi:hypothetical protein
MKAIDTSGRFASWRLLGWLVLLVGTAGCTRDEDYFKVVQEQQAAWREMIDILKTVKDTETMTDAQKTLAQNADKYAAISRKASRLPAPPPPAVRERLQQDSFLMEGMLAELKTETNRIRGLSGGEAFLKKFESTKGLLSAVER